MKIGSIELPPIPHGSTNEKLIVGKLVTDLLAAGLTITIWNGGDESEIENSTDAAAIFAALAASDEDELVLEKDEQYAGWVRLVWGNDCDIISDYSTRLEDVMAAANELADELGGDEPFDDENIYGLASVRQSIEEDRAPVIYQRDTATGDFNKSSNFASAAEVAYHYHGTLPSYEEALLDPAKARVLFDASKGGNVRGITEDHRFQLANVFMSKRRDLFSIATLIELMKARGWRVQGNSDYAECFAPDHSGPDAVRNFDSVYSTCTTTLSDRPRSGYGYNPFFYGPWHTGMIQWNDAALQTILSHPSMAGVEI